MREGIVTAGRTQALSHFSRNVHGGDQEDGRACLQAGRPVEGRVGGQRTAEGARVLGWLWVATPTRLLKGEGEGLEPGP